MRRRLRARLRRSLLWFLLAAASGLFFEVLAWVTRTDFQAPLFAVYELERNGRIQVGAGTFCGFVDMYEMAEYETKAAGWRWSALGAAVDWEYPKSIWAPYSRVKVREGIGGSGVTLLGGNGSGRAGVRGPGARSA